VSIRVSTRVPVRDLKRRPVLQALLLSAIKTLLARLVDARRHGLGLALLAALLILGSARLFLEVLEEVATGDVLVDVDVIVHGVLQQLRTPKVDSAMVAATELGDVQVLLPVILASLAWFVWRRLWRTSLYWLAAVGVAQILVKVLKLALQRPRPGTFYDGVEAFAFPSGHATMSVVAYGFLAFLICRKQRAGARLLIAATAAVLVALIAFSRLYLGVHWASDVIAGASFGLAWIGALALAYSYRSDEDVRPNQLAVVVVATLLVSGSWHIMRSHAHDSLRYAPPSTLGARNSADLCVENRCPDGKPTSSPRGRDDAHRDARPHSRCPRCGSAQTFWGQNPSVRGGGKAAHMRRSQSPFQGRKL